MIRSPLTTSPDLSFTPSTLFPDFSRPTTSHPPRTLPPSFSTLFKPTSVARAASAHPPTGFAYPSRPFNGPVGILAGIRALSDSGVGVRTAGIPYFTKLAYADVTNLCP